MAASFISVCAVAADWEKSAGSIGGYGPAGIRGNGVNMAACASFPEMESDITICANSQKGAKPNGDFAPSLCIAQAGRYK
ncbi:hypothetical protein C1N76_10580 [Geobacillus thermoleovorans]|uniref:Uncharacterized protein n=2 Tax=Geobacillus thermoleovorans TaxID=33941 RepID=A0A2Z3N7Q1_GEOTH|nr:hypothetical protein C1N76_10580 [Geobacillus thermoleovorans]